MLVRLARDDDAVDVVVGHDTRELLRRAEHARDHRVRLVVQRDPPDHVAFTFGLSANFAWSRIATAASPISTHRSGWVAWRAMARAATRHAITISERDSHMNASNRAPIGVSSTALSRR